MAKDAINKIAWKIWEDGAFHEPIKNVLAKYKKDHDDHIYRRRVWEEVLLIAQEVLDDDT